MAPFSINTITFILGKEFIFGSFNFITDIDGRLHVSNLEMIWSGPIESDPASYNVAHSSSESNSTQLEKRTIPPRYPFGLKNSADTYQQVLY